ncbi:MAG: MATE family efflux transporter, partial [Lachnospiraceae bacterium]|nr:MATE family efflux transporter [Lachnospiraceae bacterium]
HVFITGAPSFVSEVSSGVVMMIFNMIILGILGNIGVAAYGIIANLSLVVLAIYTGIAQGIQPVISKYYGMGKRDNVQAIFRYAVSTVVILSGIIYLCMFFMADGIAAIFNSEGNGELQRIAVEGIRLYFTACVFAGFNIVISIYFASTDCAKPANMVSLLRGFFLIVPMAFVLSVIWKMTGLWLAFPVTEFVVAMTGIFVCIKGRKLSGF